MPGGTAHTAGGEKTDAEGPSYIDAVRSLGPEYYFNFHKRPCVRDSQLQGLAAGFAGGSIAAIIGSELHLYSILFYSILFYASCLVLFMDSDKNRESSN
jgi:cytochrome c oxidase assembly protein subunit 20